MSAFLEKKTHPERQEDEYFIGNADSGTYPNIGWKTKRKGSVAYGTDGKPLGNRWPGAFPVFAKKSEIALDPSQEEALKFLQGLRPVSGTDPDFDYEQGKPKV